MLVIISAQHENTKKNNYYLKGQNEKGERGELSRGSVVSNARLHASITREHHM